MINWRSIFSYITEPREIKVGSKVCLIMDYSTATMRDLGIFVPKGTIGTVVRMPGNGDNWMRVRFDDWKYPIPEDLFREIYGSGGHEVGWGIGPDQIELA
jgi:hypothetical protein